MGRDPVRASWRLGRRTRRFLLGMIIVLAVVIGGTYVHPPYVVNRAGPAVNTLGDLGGGPIIDVAGASTYPTQGTLSFTTVAQYGGPGYEFTAWTFLAALLDPRAEVLPYDVVYPPDATAQNVQDATTAQMTSSQNSAEAVAFARLGYAEQTVVSTVMSDGPSAGKLQAGDRVMAVNGTPVTRTAQVSRLIQQADADKPVQLAVLRSGQRRTESVATIAAGNGRRIIGVGLEADFPQAPKVTINAGQVGGPSAGLMFALGVYDKLTPGALTGGAAIAGTGTMSLDGSVGPIGGIAHKMAGAAAYGASWFLAPSGNCEQVAGKVPDGMSVVRVSSFDEAISAVERIASGQGSSLPAC